VERVVRSRPAWSILAVLALAGCMQDPSPVRVVETGPEVTVPLVPTYGPATCANVLLFQFVDYAQTDAYLPPGFHPRDPQGFLQTAVAFGQAGILLMALRCESPTMGPLNVSFVAIFVEPPVVDGLEPGTFDFFELARYGPATEFGGALHSPLWPTNPADVLLTTLDPATSGMDVMATVTDGEGEVAWVAGTAAAGINVGTGPTRFWHQSNGGLAYIEYDANLDANIGSGLCRARAGTPFAAFVGQPAVGIPGLGRVSCPGLIGQADDTADPVVAIITDPQFNATFHRLDGVYAG
jgi:hypothetical protein